MDMWLIGLQDITYREIRIYPKKSCSHPQFGSIWRIEGAKLKTDDGNSLGNLHASRKLKVIFLVAPFPHLLNLLDSPVPPSPLPFSSDPPQCSRHQGALHKTGGRRAVHGTFRRSCNPHA